MTTPETTDGARPSKVPEQGSKLSTLLVPMVTLKRGEDVGLSDALNASWPPAQVDPRYSCRANLAFIALMALFLAAAAWTVSEAFLGRDSPPVSFSRDIASTSFEMPYWTVCRPAGPRFWDPKSTFEWDIGCAVIDDADGARVCTFTETDITGASGDACRVVKVNELSGNEVRAACADITGGGNDACQVVKVKEVIAVNEPALYSSRSGRVIAVNEPALFLKVGIVNAEDPYDWVTAYLTDYEPQNGVDWDTIGQAYEFGWYKLGNAFTAKLTKQNVKTLRTKDNRLRVAYDRSTSYSLTTTYQGDAKDQVAAYAGTLGDRRRRNLLAPAAAALPPPAAVDAAGAATLALPHGAAAHQKAAAPQELPREGAHEAERALPQDGGALLHEGGALLRDAAAPSRELDHLGAAGGGAAAAATTDLPWLVMYMRTNGLGVDQLEEMDPVQYFSLLGSIAGFFGYFLLAFSLLFGGAITANMKALEDLRIREILRQERGAGVGATARICSSAQLEDGGGSARQVEFA
ncbi:hypothetical protein JKP88DRAFT_283495 [Tribonema minus]|uniref:Uncharacterized protein n=1 Tax=Tribonema minus TaxID=303371 RepID=A0A835YI24_9STRA|nr:hypothetical protein JKP88DRAFT_283495 [Tribonema minus]